MSKLKEKNIANDILFKLVILVSNGILQIFGVQYGSLRLKGIRKFLHNKNAYRLINQFLSSIAAFIFNTGYKTWVRERRKKLEKLQNLRKAQRKKDKFAGKFQNLFSQGMQETISG